MKVEITVTRIYEMDEQKVLCEPGFEPPAVDAFKDEIKDWLKESFFELCGFERDQDHVDGTYVSLVTETSEAEFEWNETLR